MNRVFNFSAGPAALPVEVLEQVRDEMLDWHGQGMSVMEMSHRGKAFGSIAQQAEADLRELLSVPSNYKVLFLQGGATAQFAAVPLNLTAPGATADYVNTGAWSKKAIGEAKRYCKVNVAADEAANNYTTVPAQGSLKLTPGAGGVEGRRAASTQGERAQGREEGQERSHGAPLGRAPAPVAQKRSHLARVPCVAPPPPYRRRSVLAALRAPRRASSVRARQEA